MHFLLFVFVLQLKYLCVMSKGNGRELKFCKQTKLNSILQLGETIHFQFIAGVWMWYPRELDIHWEIAQSAQPQRDLNLVRLFYLNVNDTSDMYLQLTHDRMTGFLVRTPNFTGIPANTGLLMNGNFNHHMWIKAVGQPCGCLRRTSYRELEEREMLDDPGVKRLLWSLRGTKHRMLHFIETHNKLVVTFKQQKGNCKSRNIVSVDLTEGILSFTSHQFLCVYGHSRWLQATERLPTGARTNQGHVQQGQEGVLLYGQGPRRV